MKRPRATSSLQNKILLPICNTENPNFKTLESEISKSRETIEKSLNSLVEKKFVDKINLQGRKIKISFKPTIKGMIYSIGFLGIQLSNIKNKPKNFEQLKDYERHIKETAKEELINGFAIAFSQNLINIDFFDDDGNLKTINSFSLTEQFLRLTLLDDLKNNNFDIKELFYYKKTGLDMLKENCNPSGLIPLKTILTKIKTNFKESVKMLSN